MLHWLRYREIGAILAYPGGSEAYIGPIQGVRRPILEPFGPIQEVISKSYIVNFIVNIVR